jgi:hypothetical protein
VPAPAGAGRARIEWIADWMADWMADWITSELPFAGDNTTGHAGRVAIKSRRQFHAVTRFSTASPLQRRFRVHGPPDHEQGDADDGRFPDSRVIALARPSRFPSGIVEQRLSAYSCGGSHGFGGSGPPYRVPCYLPAPVDGLSAGNHHRLIDCHRGGRMVKVHW